MHSSTFEYLKPSESQLESMKKVRSAAASYMAVLQTELPESPDKTHTLRVVRDAAMWANIAITRLPDGTPRKDQ